MTDEATPDAKPEAKIDAKIDARPDGKADAKVLAGSDGVSRVSALPPHFPPWAGKLAELYFSGTTSMFVIHGNTFDVVRAGQEDARWIGLADFLAEQLFGRWDLVIHYEIGRAHV